MGVAPDAGMLILYLKMISRIRRTIAVFVGLIILVFTLGRVKLNWKGTSTCTEGKPEAPISSKK